MVINIKEGTTCFPSPFHSTTTILDNGAAPVIMLTSSVGFFPVFKFLAIRTAGRVNDRFSALSFLSDRRRFSTKQQTSRRHACIFRQNFLRFFNDHGEKSPMRWARRADNSFGRVRTYLPCAFDRVNLCTRNYGKNTSKHVIRFKILKIWYFHRLIWLTTNDCSLFCFRKIGVQTCSFDQSVKRSLKMALKIVFWKRWYIYKTGLTQRHFFRANKF